VEVVIGGGPVDAALLDALPKLRLVVVNGVGLDRIDVAGARARGVLVANVPHVTDACVADMAMGLLIAAWRGIVAGDRFVRAGKWPAGPFPVLHRMSGRRMGILGCGRIGRAIARRAEAFDMTITYHNRRPDPSLPYGWRDSPLALAADADVLVIATPGGAGTRGLVDAAVLRALGPRGVLVNIGRGSVVDEAALIAALRDRTIAAAGLDVFTHEPVVPEAFFGLDNVVLMPHRAGGTVETWEDCADAMVETVQRFLRGEAVEAARL
jgi:lactate dehydrogenase-like 2-hydroxyacid dehydrogenase